MPPKGSLETGEIAREILAYLSEHPEAADTLEGIVTWWLLEKKVKMQTGAAQDALKELVHQKRLLEVRIGDKIFFRLRRASRKPPGSEPIGSGPED